MEWDDILAFSRWGKQTYTVPWYDLEHTLARYQTENNLELNPDFQREHVWSEIQQVKYVEYILKRGNLNLGIVFNCPGWLDSFEGQMVLVDGKQRLQAARLFMANQLSVFNGVYRNDFVRQGKTMLRFSQEIQFVFYMNDLSTRTEILQLYLDINSGGVVHSDDELSKVKALLAIEQNKLNTSIGV